jgi:hypothetical protein
MGKESEMEVSIENTLVAVLGASGSGAGPGVLAPNSCNYHWARTTTSFNLKLGDNVTAAWDAHLVTTAADWSASDVLDTYIVAGLVNPKNCRPTAGRVEVCNAKYGNNGWLGIAQIWITGGVHITQGVTKVNDTYFNTAAYNTPAWRNLVMCQEVGHTLGLGHQDENFNNANLNTCMDYTSNPESNQHPNTHDYDELNHLHQSLRHEHDSRPDDHHDASGDERHRTGRAGTVGKTCGGICEGTRVCL